MYDIISGFLRILKFDPISTDNNVFRLHYKATTFVLLLCSCLLIQRQYFGDPIDCITNSRAIDIIDTFCWIQSTFSVLDYKDKFTSSHPGVKTLDGSTEHRYHTYYQWLTLILLIQAGMFYLPHYIWKIWEGERLKKLIEGMHLFIMKEKEIEAKKDFLVHYFKLNLNKQDAYAYKYIACEILNFVNVVAQIFITDACLGYEFTTYGLKVFNKLQEPFQSRFDPLEFVFPKVSKCAFSSVGSSGTTQLIDAICVLPLNILSEKIYIFLWFWFIIIAAFSGLGLLFRLCTFLPIFRRILMKSRAKICNSEELHLINHKCRIGDWFLLYQIAKNMEENTFKSFVSNLATEMRMTKI